MTSKCHFYISPVLASLTFIASYYLYIIAFCVYQVGNLLSASLYLFFCNIIFVLFVWSFLSSVCTPIARVPSEYRLTDEEAETYLRNSDQHRDSLLKSIQAKKNLVLHMRGPYGSIRYCIVCKVIKPDRAHHCSTCGVCVLKMDHHCAWINNCVGFSNQKYFLLMLFYCNVYCLYIIATTLEQFIAYITTYDQKYIYTVTGFVIAAFLEIIGGMFMLLNCGLMCRNETMVEKMQHVVLTQENATFDLGCAKNFLEVFGNNWRIWMFPVFSSLGDGVVFPFRIKDS